MACSSAYISLSASLQNTEELTYEIEIGANGNSKTVLRDSVGGSTILEENTPSILDCNEWKSFWLRWSTINDETQVEMGSGADVDSKRILHHSFSGSNAFNIKALSMAAHPDIGAHSYWEVAAPEGEIYMAVLCRIN